jgi:hypothetical protein
MGSWSWALVRADDVIEIPDIPGDLTQQEHIWINLQALIIYGTLAIAVVLAVYFGYKRYLKKRYAASQAKLAAEGRTDRSNALAEIANNPQTRFVNDDATFTPEAGRAAIFGDNYRPYGDDAMNNG